MIYKKILELLAQVLFNVYHSLIIILFIIIILIVIFTYNDCGSRVMEGLMIMYLHNEKDIVENV